jgi:isopropylmalate/homocitrate/citramalate synthase
VKKISARSSADRRPRSFFAGRIDRCWQALEQAARPRIHTFLATSDIHLKYKFNKSRGEALDIAVKAVERARKLCDEVEFSAEDAGRTEINYLCTVFDAVIDAGATIVNVPDTVGYQTPAEYGQLIRTLRERLKNPTASPSARIAMTTSVLPLPTALRRLKMAPVRSDARKTSVSGPGMRPWKKS